MKGFECTDCNKDTIDEYYMVHNKLWAEAKINKPAKMLCFQCLENRIGRKLTKEDFPLDIPVNQKHLERFKELK